MAFLGIMAGSTIGALLPIPFGAFIGSVIGAFITAAAGSLLAYRYRNKMKQPDIRTIGVLSAVGGAIIGSELGSILFIGFPGLGDLVGTLAGAVIIGPLGAAMATLLRKCFPQLRPEILVLTSISSVIGAGLGATLGMLIPVPGIGPVVGAIAGACLVPAIGTFMAYMINKFRMPPPDMRFNSILAANITSTVGAGLGFFLCPAMPVVGLIVGALLGNLLGRVIGAVSTKLSKHFVKDDDPSSHIFCGISAAVGANLGATLGSAFLPGLGTALGAAAGALIFGLTTRLIFSMFQCYTSTKKISEQETTPTGSSIQKTSTQTTTSTQVSYVECWKASIHSLVKTTFPGAFSFWHNAPDNSLNNRVPSPKIPTEEGSPQVTQLGLNNS